MANVCTFKSSQSGAPSLSGTVGSLISLLDACLVNGYGSVSVSSITQSGNVATVTTASAHGFSTGDRVTVSGANQTDYNISAYVTVTSTTTFTYTVANNPVSPATGTISVKRASANWTKPYSATNKAVYRMNPTGNTGFYLNVQDTGPGAGGAKEARAWGYEVATAQDTGTGQFPTTAQMANGQFIRKSATADTTARAWTLIADDSCFYLITETGDYTSPTIAFGFAFGDFFKYGSSDAYNCAIIGRSTENSSSNTVDMLALLSVGGTSVVSNLLTAHYTARLSTGVGGSAQFGKHSDGCKLGTSVGSAGGAIGYSVYGALNYPNSPDGGLYLAPVWLHQSSNVRGYFKGWWCPCHHLPLSHGDTFSGTGAMAGKSFIALNTGNANTNSTAGQSMFETSNTWS